VNTIDSSFTIRVFDDADTPELTRLLHASYAELGRMNLNYTAVDQSEETTRYRAQGGRCWVIEHNDSLVATLTMSLPPAKALQQLTTEAQHPQRAWLNQVAVSPSLRSRGLARHLWILGKEWAAQQGATSIGVDTAVPATHLVGLYSRWGFERRDIIHWDGKTYDSVVMVLPDIRSGSAG
jgi:GNAT superfamily N-acetyltransferase